MIRKWRFLAAILLVLFQLSRPATSQTVGFKPAQSYPVGTAPSSLAVGDFNGDGNLDLAVANYGDPTVNDGGNVSILLGNGDGTFQPAINITAGKGPASIVVADFNSDTRPDLAVADFGNVITGDPGGVSILLGNGDGTFQPAKNFAAGGNPQYLAAADFNGDHKPDLVVGGAGLDTTLRVFLGNGDGTFQAPVDYPGAGGSVKVADFNGDGNFDLVITGTAILLGNGDGSFQAAVDYSLGKGKLAIGTCVGDFNGDQKLDLALGVRVSHFPSPSTSEMDVLVGNGDGTFQGPVVAFVGFRGSACSVADFDGDGKLDLAMSNGPLGVFLGKGDATFQPPVFLDGGGSTGSVAVADFNGDKAPDLVVTTNLNTISVLLNSTGAEFSITASAPSPPTVSRGQSSASTVTLNHLNAFDNPVTLACSVQPTQSSPTCSLNPNSVTFDANGSATATLTVNTGAATALLVPSFLRQDSRPLQFLWLPVAGLAFMGAGVSRGSSSKRRLLGFFVGCVLFAGLIPQAACGGGSSSPTSQTYTITVTGTSGSAQHSTAVTLTVQ